MTKKKQAPKQYYTANVFRFAHEQGIVVDTVMLDNALVHIRHIDLTQKQFDVVMMLHIEAVSNLFDAKRFPILARIAVAAHFLGLIDLKKRNKKALSNGKQ